MAITEEEIKKDFERFIRHEAMRANTTQDEIIKVLIRKSVSMSGEDILRVLGLI